MFPSEELVFEDPSIFEQDKILDDLLADCTALKEDELTDYDKGAKKRRRKTSSTEESQENKNDACSSDSKKTVHREIERQRRQEMAGLYASLRELLPLEYVKGKRAISDHMHQAVNYIKDMQKEIEEMKTRRDKLKKLLSSVAGATFDADNQNSGISYLPYLVKVNLFRDALEILISSSLKDESFPLSKVLADLLGRGLNVITCISAKGDDCFHHRLQIQLNNTTSNIDLSELQERLVNLIKLA